MASTCPVDEDHVRMLMNTRLFRCIQEDLSFIKFARKRFFRMKVFSTNDCCQGLSSTCLRIMDEWLEPEYRALKSAMLRGVCSEFQMEVYEILSQTLKNVCITPAMIMIGKLDEFMPHGSMVSTCMICECRLDLEVSYALL